MIKSVIYTNQATEYPEIFRSFIWSGLSLPKRERSFTHYILKDEYYDLHYVPMTTPCDFEVSVK